MQSLVVPLRLLIALLSLLALPFNAAARISVDAPEATDRYVSPVGTDSGNCTNPASPCLTITYARNQSSNEDTIHLAAGEYVENVSLNKAVNLEGAGAGTTIINGNASGTSVFVNDNGIPVTISHLTIRNGSASYGGGLGNISELILDDVIIEDNHASNQGGGIYNEGDLTILNSIVRNNTSSVTAGGMMNHGTAVVSDSAFLGNKVPESGVFAGGIHNNDDATLELTNVTISKNQAPNAAGLNSGGTAYLVNVTIADNIGDGIGNFYLGSAVNSIFSGNTQGNCGVSVPSLGNNLDSGTSCGFSEAGDLQNTPALLAPLGYYNSTIPTYSLWKGSPAIDSANAAYCPAEDARGVTRPIDGDGVGGAVCDRGAHEYDPAADFGKLFLPLLSRN